MHELLISPISHWWQRWFVLYVLSSLVLLLSRSLLACFSVHLAVLVPLVLNLVHHLRSGHHGSTCSCWCCCCCACRRPACASSRYYAKQICWFAVGQLADVAQPLSASGYHQCLDACRAESVHGNIIERRGSALLPVAAPGHPTGPRRCSHSGAPGPFRACPARGPTPRQFQGLTPVQGATTGLLLRERKTLCTPCLPGHAAC